MAEFRFEHTVTITEKDWVEIFRTPEHSRRRRSRMSRVARIGGLIIIGVSCLFWSYTLLLGVAILSLFLIAAVVPQVLKLGTQVMCEYQKHMVEPSTHGVDSDGIWLRTPSLEARARWPLLISWQIRGDWLILSTSGVGIVLLPISDMRQAGAFDSVFQLVRKHGNEYK